MTAIWDTVQEYLRVISEVDDPSLFKTGLEPISEVISSIHDIDHNQNERISRSISSTRGYKDVEQFLRKLRERSRR